MSEEHKPDTPEEAIHGTQDEAPQSADECVEESHSQHGYSDEPQQPMDVALFEVSPAKRGAAARKREEQQQRARVDNAVARSLSALEVISHATKSGNSSDIQSRIAELLDAEDTLFTDVAPELLVPPTKSQTHQQTSRIADLTRNTEYDEAVRARGAARESRLVIRPDVPLRVPKLAVTDQYKGVGSKFMAEEQFQPRDDNPRAAVLAKMESRAAKRIPVSRAPPPTQPQGPVPAKKLQRGEEFVPACASAVATEHGAEARVRKEAALQAQQVRAFK